MIQRGTAINHGYGLPGQSASPETFASISLTISPLGSQPYRISGPSHIHGEISGPVGHPGCRSLLPRTTLFSTHYSYLAHIFPYRTTTLVTNTPHCENISRKLGPFILSINCISTLDSSDRLLLLPLLAFQ